jgi:2-C-methyl-D-erythritol 2,4-cyclodiphosphate synthase
MGFDIHRLVPDQPLILGGVTIPHPQGLKGHSDADVLLHALCDALLGAVGEGDMGTYFPDTDPKWKDASSRIFVVKALERVKAQGGKISNVDLVMLTAAPRLAPHRSMIRQSIASILEVDPSQVNVKAKTMQGLGPVGEGQAMAAYAVVLLERGK